MEQVAEKRYTEEEYFALELAERDIKHEFFGGEIIAMAGAEMAHNSICANIIGELRNEIIKKNKKCRVLTSGQRVRGTTKNKMNRHIFIPTSCSSAARQNLQQKPHRKPCSIRQFSLKSCRNPTQVEK